MWALPSLVNAEGVSFTESKSSAKMTKARSMKVLIETVSKGGQDSQLTSGLGPHVELAEHAPVKFLSLQPNEPEWIMRICDLVYESNHPHCFVLFDKRKSGDDVTFMHYRFDLTGRLLNAHKMTGKNDENGKPIHGSAQDFQLDITNEEIRRDAEKELDFWLSGRYKKYLAKTAAPAR